MSVNPPKTTVKCEKRNKLELHYTSKYCAVEYLQNTIKLLHATENGLFFQLHQRTVYGKVTVGNEQELAQSERNTPPPPPSQKINKLGNHKISNQLLI